MTTYTTQDTPPPRKIHKGLTGLANLGNTCFLNSCMQILAHTPEFSQMKQKYEHHEKRNIVEYEILCEFEELRELMTNNEGVISPEKFVMNVHKIAKIKNRPLFTGWMQNDMPEFLLFMMECIHAVIQRPVEINIKGHTSSNQDKLATHCYGELKKVYETEYSEIMHNFYGMYYSEIVSLENPNIILSIKPEQYFILDLPVPYHQRHISIYDCLEQYCHNDELTGENAWYNELTGQKENVAKRIRFWNFPSILVITFKRFTPDGMHKLQNHIDFPIRGFDLSRYVQGYNSDKYVYDLYGICNHMGGVHGGHYTAYVNHKEISNLTVEHKDGIWLHHNDENIDLVDENHLVSPTAYCLFYRKRA